MHRHKNSGQIARNLQHTISQNTYVRTMHLDINIPGGYKFMALLYCKHALIVYTYNNILYNLRNLIIKIFNSKEGVGIVHCYKSKQTRSNILKQYTVLRTLNYA